MYTADLLKDKLTALYTKFGYTMPEDLTKAYKQLSGVQSFKFVADSEMTVEQMFENATTDKEKEYVFNSLVRLLPHGAKGIDWEDTTEPDADPTEEPTVEPTVEPTTEPTADPAKIAEITTQEKKDELIENIESKKGSTDTEDLAKYDLDNDGDIDEGDKNIASTIVVEETSEPVEAEWDFIHDKASWDAAYEKPTMQAYYEWSDRINKPYKEDLYNTVEGRAANWNDAREDSNGEKVVDENGNYIYDNCERCWEGAINAPGAKYPWAVVTLPEGFEGVIKFTYDGGEPVYPFGEESKQFQNIFGVVSIPTEFGDEYLLNSDGETTFDPSKLEILLVK